MFEIVVAYDKNKTIGHLGWMPWDLPEDLKHFKEVTNNSKLLMGRTTFETLKKPLPNRITYVLSSKEVAESKNVRWVKDLDEFINKYKESEEVIYVCGGASIYKQLLPYSQKLIISIVEGDYPSDTVFPDFNLDDYKIVLEKQYEGFAVYNFYKK